MKESKSERDRARERKEDMERVRERESLGERERGRYGEKKFFLHMIRSELAL